MKKALRIIYPIVILILIICLISSFGNLKKAKDDDNLLCQVSVSESYEAFKNYSESGNEDMYLFGISEFRTFMQVHYFLYQNTSHDEHLLLNEIYMNIALNSEEIKENIDMLVEALKYLDEDYTNPNGYLRLRNYSHFLNHSEN